MKIQYFQILGFADLGGLELDIKRIRGLEVLDFHGLNGQLGA